MSIQSGTLHFASLAKRNKREPPKALFSSLPLLLVFRAPFHLVPPHFIPRDGSKRWRATGRCRAILSLSFYKRRPTAPLKSTAAILRFAPLLNSPRYSRPLHRCMPSLSRTHPLSATTRHTRQHVYPLYYTRVPPSIRLSFIRYKFYLTPIRTIDSPGNKKLNWINSVMGIIILFARRNFYAPFSLPPG